MKNRALAAWRRWRLAIGPERETITPELIAELPLEAIETVVFYKRDEVTADLICCDVALRECVRTFHEEASGWHDLINHLSRLPGFRTDWYASVVNPPFALGDTVAYRRS